MMKYNLIQYSDNYSKTSGSLWQYYRDELATDASVIDDFPGNNASFILNLKITGKTENNGTHNIDTVVPL